MPRRRPRWTRERVEIRRRGLRAPAVYRLQGAAALLAGELAGALLLWWLIATNH